MCLRRHGPQPLLGLQKPAARLHYPCSAPICQGDVYDFTSEFKYPSNAEGHDHSSPFRGKKRCLCPQSAANSTGSPLSQPTQLASLDFNGIVNRTADVPKNKAAFSLSDLTSQIDLMKRIHHTKTKCPSLISNMGQAGAHGGFNCHSLHRRFLRCVCGLELVCAVRQLS